jgi:hypothetical protein
MNLNLFPFLILFFVLAAIVLAMIVWRKVVATHEDNFVHVMGETPAVSEQATVAHKLEQIDKWGKLLTAITVIYGLAIAGLYMWQTWVTNSNLPSGQ